MTIEQKFKQAHHNINQAHVHHKRMQLNKRLLAGSGSLLALSFMSFIALFGVSRAAAPRLFVAVESENGTRSGNTSVVDDSSAAGKKYIKFQAASGGGTTPTNPPTNPPTTPPVTTTKVRRFPGDPNPKLYNKAYWGSSIGGNGDPSRHETPTGKSLAIRRTFWQWDEADGGANDKMFVSVRDDLAHNRLPQISVKPPTWKDVGDGKYDAVLDSMLRQLDSYGKPIWFTVHHEPEGGGSNGNTPDDPGGAPEWRRMQSRVRARMTAIGTKNIAFMPILMSYTWNTASGRTPNDWWVSGIWDAYCVDHYRDNVSGNMFSANWTPFVTWVEAKGLPYCTGEWGNRGTDATAASEMQAFWDWSFNNKKDVVAYSYFDSGLNSPNGSWELVGEPLTKFQAILKSDAKVQRINDL